MKKLGISLLAELYGCKKEILGDMEKIKSLMEEAVDVIGATRVKSLFYKSKKGIDGVIVISESHLGISTDSKKGYAALDLFTCCQTKEIDPRPGMEFLKEKLGANKMYFLEIPRGLENTLEEFSKKLTNSSPG